MGQYGSSIAWMMTERVLTETAFLSNANAALAAQIKEQTAKIERTLDRARALDNGEGMQGLLKAIEAAVEKHNKAFADAAEMVHRFSDSKTHFMAQLNTYDAIVKEAIGLLSGVGAPQACPGGSQPSGKAGAFPGSGCQVIRNSFFRIQ